MGRRSAIKVRVENQLVRFTAPQPFEAEEVIKTLGGKKSGKYVILALKNPRATLLVDEEGRELPQDGKTPGRILLYSPSITREYYKEPAKTQKAWRFGYFDVDDIVTIDPYGSIMFVDREKDAIKSGGEWIPSSRLEGFISRHPSVAEVAVVAMPHEKWVERPVALIVPRPEYRGKVSEEEIKNFLLKEFVEKGLMPKWWIPDKIVFVDELPKTSTGKINKRVIREKLKEFLK
jgi:fatty-acyl-CoA synthase